MKNYFVYILASGKNGTLYTGVTSNLAGRVDQHKSKSVKGFTQKYGVGNLVYCESLDSAEEAIVREKRLKKWNREWKLRLIESTNPNWEDLSKTFLFNFSGFPPSRE